MAHPRVFVSSTYYDLKHLRSSLELFIESLGYDSILSEKGQVAYTSELPLDEACYREVQSASIFVLIVGGRYGSETSEARTSFSKEFYERYTSITRAEYQTAVERDIPIYVLVERGVYAEYQTFLKNRENTAISYAHVDSVNVFELIDYIIAQPKNNPLQQFDRYSEIETWLREQWAGLLHELLTRSQEHKQLASLQSEVAQLSELNTTLKSYLEEVISKLVPDRSQRLIKEEDERRREALLEREFNASSLGRYLLRHFGDDIRDIVITASDWNMLVAKLIDSTKDKPEQQSRAKRLTQPPVRKRFLRDLNSLRASTGTSELSYDSNMQAADEEAAKAEELRRNERVHTIRARVAEEKRGNGALGD